jgi:subtilisin family serine protease
MTDGAWSEPCIGLVDTGVNAWHSHVRGDVAGCRLYLDAAGGIAEDDDFSDPLGHGTAVAGILREALPGARLFVVRVFGETGTTFPSLVARGILRAAAEGCGFVNVSLGVAPGPGAEVLREACAAAIAAGCTLAAPAPADRPGWLPASLPGVYAVTADDALAPGDVVRDAPYRLRAAGRPRDLAALPREWNLQGHSFACARALAQLARCGLRP